MPNVLEVQIVGDVSALEKSLKQAEKLQAEYTSSIEKTSKELAENIAISRNYAKAIEELDKELKSGSISSKEYSAQLSKLKKDEQETKVATADLRKELANLKREQKDLGNGFQKDLTPKIANGGNALMQFSRIAQDAPFGIIGIGNNLTATAESFGHLSKQAGGTGAALKAVASSMLGSGGILLAVSLVTTGLTYMAQQGLSVEDVFDKLTGSFDENANAIKKASIEGAKAASEEIISMKALVAAAQDETISRNDRLIAVEKLQQQYPAYFGNLSKEAILTGDITKVTDELTKALIQKSVAEKLSADSAEIQLKIFEANAKLVNQKNKTSQLEIKLANDLAAAQKSVGNSAAQLATINAKGVNAINASKEAEKEARNEIIQGTEALKQRQDIINRLTASSIKTLFTPDEETKTTKDKDPKILAESQKLLEKLRGIATEMQMATSVPLFEIDEKTTSNLDKLAELAFQMKDITSVPLFEIDEKTEENLNKLKELSQEMAFTVAENFNLAEQAGKLFSDGVGSAVGALGSELAASLETGNAALDAFVGSVIQGFAEIAAAQLAGLIAKQTIAAASLTTDAAVSTGNAVVAATETASATGPAAAFVLPALVGAAIGFIAASFAGIKFAHGGVVPGGSFTGDKVPAMLNSGEIVMNRQQQANTLMAIGNGNANSLQNNVKSDNFILETALRGSDLLLAIKREEKKR